MNELSQHLYLLPLALVGLWLLARRSRAAYRARFDSSPQAKHERLILLPFYVAVCGVLVLAVAQALLTITELSTASKRTILAIAGALGGTLLVAGAAGTLLIPFVLGFFKNGTQLPRDRSGSGHFG